MVLFLERTPTLGPFGDGSLRNVKKLGLEPGYNTLQVLL
jgi:hypothetical protein